MPLRPIVTTDDIGAVTVTGLGDDVEFDPAVIGEVAAFDVVVTVSKSKYRVVGFNPGNGYLKAKKVK